MHSIGLSVVVEPKVSASLDQTEKILENSVLITKTSAHLALVVSKMVLRKMVMSEMVLRERVLIEKALIEMALREAALRGMILVKGIKSAFHAAF